MTSQHVLNAIHVTDTRAGFRNRDFDEMFADWAKSRANNPRKPIIFGLQTTPYHFVARTDDGFLFGTYRNADDVNAELIPRPSALERVVSYYDNADDRLAISAAVQHVRRVYSDMLARPFPNGVSLLAFIADAATVSRYDDDIALLSHEAAIELVLRDPDRELASPALSIYAERAASMLLCDRGFTFRQLPFECRIKKEFLQDRSARERMNASKRFNETMLSLDYWQREEFFGGSEDAEDPTFLN